MKVDNDNFDSDEEMTSTRKEIFKLKVLVDLTANTSKKGELINQMGIIARHIGEINDSSKTISGAKNFDCSKSDKKSSFHPLSSCLAEEIEAIHFNNLRLRKDETIWHLPPQRNWRFHASFADFLFKTTLLYYIHQTKYRFIKVLLTQIYLE